MLNKAKSFVKNYLLKRKAYQFFIRDWVQLSDLQQAQDMMATMRFSQNLRLQSLDGPNVKRILVIAPHPDDETMGPGGSLLREIDKGAEVLTVYLTSGSNDAIAQVRESEAQSIAKQYGYKTIFLGYQPKSIPIDDNSTQRLANLINDFSPEALFLPFCLDDHDDHRRASHLLLAIEQKNLFTCSFAVWAYQVYTSILPNVIVDITDVADRKASMINRWKSQYTKRDWAHFTLGLNAFNQRFLPAGSQPRYAEAFFVLPLTEYLNYCRHYFDANAANCYYSPEYKKNLARAI